MGEQRKDRVERGGWGGLETGRKREKQRWRKNRGIERVSRRQRNRYTMTSFETQLGVMKTRHKICSITSPSS